MDKYICSRCGRILNQYEYKNYVCLCMECVNMVENEFENGKPWGDINNIDEILENKRGERDWARLKMRICTSYMMNIKKHCKM